MKKNIILLTIFLTVISLSSCELDKYPKGRWHHENYTPDSEIDPSILVLAKLNEAYGVLRSYEFAFAMPFMHSVITPNAEKGSSPTDGGDGATEIKPMSYTSSTGLIKQYWVGAYNLIYKSNEAIALANNMGAESVEKEIFAAEALTLRAWAYFLLTQAYGDVPFVDRVLGPDEKVPQRMPKTEILQNMISDLKYAVPYLPSRINRLSKGEKGRVTSNMARAVLAKIYLSTANWSGVITQTEAVINSGDNDLNTSFATIFTEANEHGSESVFEVEAEEKPSENYFSNSQYAQIQGFRGNPNLGWGFAGPSQDLKNSFEVGDLRKSATILENGDIIDGETFAADGSSYPLFNKKVFIKQSERALYGRGASQGMWVNIRLIRYSDILLMHSEASNELGNNTEALDKLNMVRTRAGLTLVSEPNQALLRDIIRKERRMELALEFGYFFDLVRWGIAKDVIPGFVVGKHEVFPIPQTEIDASNGILTQNAGY